MPIIKSISDLRNKANEISEICHKEEQPVYITKNGQGNLVVMSQALYERQQAMIELYTALAEAEEDKTPIHKLRTLDDVIKKARKKLRRK